MSKIQNPSSSVMDTTIITLPNGVTLRRFTMSDIEAAMTSLNNPAVRLYLRNVIPNPYTEADAKWWINHCNDVATWLQSGPWTHPGSQTAAAIPSGTNSTQPTLPVHYAITKDGIQIGAIGITIKDDIYLRTAELGYWLAEPYWGKGIMGAAAKAYVEWVFDTFGIVYRIEAQVSAENAASSSVLRKAGLTFEGRRKGAAWKGGKVNDEDIWGVVRDKELGA